MRLGMNYSFKGGLLATVVASVTALTLQVQGQQTYSGANRTPTTSSDTSTTSTSNDRAASRFIKEAARDNETEISLAQVGVQKAQNADLKSFSEKLQRDHMQASKELQTLAQKYNVNIEETRGEKHEVSKFEKETTGAKFDQQLATEFLKGHQKTIAKYEKASTQIQEGDVKQFIDTMLPKLRDHFQQAQTVARSVGVDESTITSVVKKTPGAVGGTSEEQSSTTGSSSRDLRENAPPSKP
jgi:putative membrane protein